MEWEEGILRMCDNGDIGRKRRRGSSGGIGLFCRCSSWPRELAVVCVQWESKVESINATSYFFRF